MTVERAIGLLSSGALTSPAPYTIREVNEACKIACDAIQKIYDPVFQQTRAINAIYAEHYRNMSLPMERLDELVAADKAGRLVILPDVACTDADGEEALRKAMRDCNVKNNGVTRFVADAIVEKLCRETQEPRLTVHTPFGQTVAEINTDPEKDGTDFAAHSGPGEDK